MRDRLFVGETAMKMTYSKVLEAARLLPPQDIVKLRDRLSERIDAAAERDESQIVDDELYEELERRRLDCEKHPEKLVPWEVVLAGLQARLK
jgi:hypothetical protein